MKILFYTLLISISISCHNSKYKTPDNLISEEKMVDVLIDFMIINAAQGSNKKILEAAIKNPVQYIFKKHNIDSLQFENSNNYYAHNVEVYNSIYQRVKKNLEAQMKIAESELEIENRKLDSLRKIKKNSSILISVDTLKGLRKRLKKNVDTTVQ